jgi:hypothetical protein
MNYTGILLHDKPHGMGILELKDVPRDDPSYGQYRAFYRFKLYGQFVNGELHGGPTLLQ